MGLWVNKKKIGKVGENGAVSNFNSSKCFLEMWGAFLDKIE